MMAGSPPHLSVKPVRVLAGQDCGELDVAWQVANVTDAPVQILEGWLPHGRVFCERWSFNPPLVVSAGEPAIIERRVRYIPQPDGVVENAFLTLRLLHHGRPWRILIRMRVESSPPRTVGLVVEAVTAQPIGFAQPREDNGAAPEQ
jgi:hypothetical protein